jgi:alanyl-tRNA synthetase
MKEDHEVSMAHNSLESIIKSAMELKMKLGNDERNIPGWIQDHITNAENYIDQAAQGFHELSHDDQESEMDELPVGNEEEPVDDMNLQSMMEDLLEAKKKPSAGLSKKQKSTIAKKAAAGKDIGKKGKGFEMIAKKAAKKYGSKERGQAVAAAAMWKSQAKKAK